jgi:outer membrane protein TolC
MVHMTPAYKEPPPESFKESDQWKTSHPNAAVLRGSWWEIFGDSQLNALEEQVTVSNQDLKMAEARFRQARALVRYDRASEFPTISVDPNIESLRYSPNEPYFPANVWTNPRSGFTLPFDLSYEVDLWGRIRRTVTSAGEEAQATAADLQTVTLSLHAELAVDYFELRSADAQQTLLDETVDQYADTLKLTTDLMNGGAAPESDVIQARTQLDTSRVEDTDIAVMRSQYEHAIAILIGKPPAKFHLAPMPLKIEPSASPLSSWSGVPTSRPANAVSRKLMKALVWRAPPISQSCSKCYWRPGRKLRRELVYLAQPVLGCRTLDDADDLRCRPASILTFRWSPLRQLNC